MPATRTRVAIIGTGFSGLGMAIALKKAGHDDFVILEKADDIGGTWRDNTYPGCACDVPTHLYSYSFEPRSDWIELFSGWREIYQYLSAVADKYDLRRHIHFGSAATSGRWDDERNEWHVVTESGREYVSQFVVSAVGALHIPNIPDIPGAKKFTGAQFHSAQWDHDFDLTGKRVAVIGTGASAVQFVPEIVDQVAELKVYQRTPPWVLPRTSVEFSARTQAAFQRVPGLRRGFRYGMYWLAESGAYAMNHRPQLLTVLERIGKAHIRRQIRDRELRAKVTPDYLPGCKRLLGSDTYYPALAARQTEVVTDGIASISRTGVVSADGTERAVDAIIYGTGFHVTDSFQSMDITGRGGESLVERFQTEGIQAYLGITVANAPNAFFLLGPNTGLGHNSIVFMIESQIRYAMDAMRLVDRNGAQAINVRRDVQDRFNTEVQRKLAGSVWNTGGCASWYLDANGVNRTLWPGFTWQYWLRTRKVDPADYELLGTHRPQVRKLVTAELPHQTFPNGSTNAPAQV
jgi:cation diffusion facilitator CzcD-associated flavoprotein CzcO